MATKPEPASERAAPSPYRLKIWALLILYQLAHHTKGEGYPKTWMLRFLLAFLYSHSNGADRAPFNGFWKAATRRREEGEPNITGGYVRGMDMRCHANSICATVGEQPKIIQDQFWQELSQDARRRHKA